ncbi:hypothetical protein BDY19DRAFT_992100 [Irpex rosettiformis]|uniref:Uncharacterized protein n=1 Tax=Irpex rosettiformis TaxID=378272 RepID=A0ACB8U8P0_9APHY|nr:hypothetical protein BDY19DRAFT_992100 [Irpex rosettiformis]
MATQSPRLWRTDSVDSLASSVSQDTVDQNGGYTEYHPITLSVEKPSLLTGYLILCASAAFLVIGSWATLISAFMPHTGIWALDVLAEDTHYKYFVLLLVPTTAYFVIGNWVGWQYYRNS